MTLDFSIGKNTSFSWLYQKYFEHSAIFPHTFGGLETQKSLCYTFLNLLYWALANNKKFFFVKSLFFRKKDVTLQTYL